MSLSTSKPRLLDLFCGAGGAAMGYHRAGFEVVGVDIEPQPHYPFEFHQADALDMLREVLHYRRVHGVSGFDAIHASPPCQAYSDLQKQNKREYPRLVEPVRALLEVVRLPYVIENVEGAPLINPVRLCGSGFGRRLQRHRLFECSGFFAMGVGCAHGAFAADLPALRSTASGSRFVGVYGTGGGAAKDIEVWREVMDVPWMQTKAEVAEAIPPYYTEHIGGYLMAALTAERAA